jgi:hypothetical protein
MGKLPNPKSFDTKLVTLARIMQTLREERNLEVLLKATLDYLCNEFDYRLVWLGLYDRLEHRLEGKGGKSPNNDSAFLQGYFAINSGDILEQLIIQQRPVAVADLRGEKRAGEWQNFAQKAGI